MNVISKDLGSGIKSITLNDPKTYNSLSFKTLNELSKLKLNYVIFAYRGFNGNKGKPYEAGLYKDAENVINWLKSKNIVENNIILYG